jgi:hypothetical protein
MILVFLDEKRFATKTGKDSREGATRGRTPLYRVEKSFI